MKNLFLLCCVLSPLAFFAICIENDTTCVLACLCYGARITVCKGSYLTRLYNACVKTIERYEEQLLNA